MEYPKMLYGVDRDDQIIVVDDKDESAARGKGYQSLGELEAEVKEDEADKPKRGRPAKVTE